MLIVAAGGAEHQRHRGVGAAQPDPRRSPTSCTQVILVGIGIVLVFSPHILVDNVHLGVAPTWSDFALGIAVGMIAYTGIETISNMAEEARDAAADDPARRRPAWWSPCSASTC